MEFPPAGLLTVSFENEQQLLERLFLTGGGEAAGQCGSAKKNDARIAAPTRSSKFYQPAVPPFTGKKRDASRRSFVSKESDRHHRR